MKPIEYRKATAAELDAVLQIRLEMLKEVNALPEAYQFDAAFVAESRSFFEAGDQMTVLAFDGPEAIGCASIAYIHVMPTFSHPTGRRAHLMNVYTRKDHRRRGISRQMVGMLIDEAAGRGVTEISLDATEMGRPLYAAMGFVDSE